MLNINKFLPMIGFEPRTSVIGSNCYTNWATQPLPMLLNILLNLSKLYNLFCSLCCIFFPLCRFFSTYLSFSPSLFLSFFLSPSLLSIPLCVFMAPYLSLTITHCRNLSYSLIYITLLCLSLYLFMVNCTLISCRCQTKRQRWLNIKLIIV